jgi:hypothetical protein
MTDKQSDGRQKNGAAPVEAATPSSSKDKAEKTGKMEQSMAGPDGPNAAEVGDTFKKQP